MSKRIWSFLLTISLILSMGNIAYAQEQSAIITVQLEPAVFSVSVPTSLPINIEDGEVSTPVNAPITNNSAAPVTISNVEIVTSNGWTIVPWDTDFGNKSLGLKEFAFKINNTEVNTDGSVVVASFGDIAGGETLEFSYQAKVAPQSGSTNESIGEVVFTISWADAITDEVITFYVGQYLYSAYKGMKWGDFIDSEFNSYGVFTVGENNVILFNGKVLHSDSGMPYKGSPIISSGNYYVAD